MVSFESPTTLERKYRLADKGLALYCEASAKSNRIFGLWDYLKEHFLTLSSEADVDSLTTEEVDAAYNKYNKEFWKEYRRRDEPKA